MPVDTWKDLPRNVKNKFLKEHSKDNLSKLFNKTLEFFQGEKELINELPVIKEGKMPIKSVSQDFIPDKKFIEHRAKTIEPEDALIELIDNIFDNYLSNLTKYNRNLNIEIKFFEQDDTFKLMIKENSGGISPDKVSPLLTYGQTSKDGMFRIATWGEAFIISIKTLGTSAHITTWFEGKNIIDFDITEEFLTEMNESKPSESYRAKINHYAPGDVINIDRGSTVLIIENIESKYSKSKLENFKTLIEKIVQTYWKKVDDIEKLHLTVNLSLDFYGNKKKCEFKVLEFNYKFSFFPLCPPVILKNQKIIEGIDDFFVDIYCGLDPFENQDRGVWMWGNGRLFQKSLQDADVGYGLTDQTGIRNIGTRRSFSMLTVFLFFKSKDPKYNIYIPWMSPAKNAYNRTYKYKERILELIKSVVKRFIYVMDVMKTAAKQLQLFTYKFIEFEDDEKNRFLREKKYHHDDDGEIDANYIKENFSQLLELKELISFDEYDSINDLEKKNEKLIKALKNYDFAVKKASEKLNQGVSTTIIKHLKHFLPEKEELEEEIITEAIRDLNINIQDKTKKDGTVVIDFKEEISEENIFEEKTDGDIEVERKSKEKQILEEKTQSEKNLIKKLKETIPTKKHTLPEKKTHMIKKRRRKIPITNEEKLQKVIEGTKKTIKKARAATPTDTLRITIEKGVTNKILELFDKNRAAKNKSASGAIKEILYLLSKMKKGDKFE